MKVVDVLCMNRGTGEISYANNSLLQKEVLQRTKSVRDQAIHALCGVYPFPSLCIADLGCSSGPNTLFVVSDIIGTVHNKYRSLGLKSPEFRINLNDLPMNDFNTVFRSLQIFQETMKKEIGLDLGPCFFAGVPGSFYGRLFPEKCLHFVHASYCLTYMSQLSMSHQAGSAGVGKRNGKNIYLAQSSPPSVIKAYYEQFQRDFSMFLKSRSEELIGGGRMVLTMLGINNDGSRCNSAYGYLWEFVSVALNKMVLEGTIEEEKLNSFNIPFYKPSPAQVQMEIFKEGSFTFDHLEMSTTKWSACKIQDPSISLGHNFARNMRAVIQPLLASYFGQAHMDNFFNKFGEVMATCMAKEDPENINITISLTRKL